MTTKRIPLFPRAIASGAWRSSTKRFFILLSALMLLTGCFGNRFTPLFNEPAIQLIQIHTSPSYTVEYRPCAFREIERFFATPDEFSHYYHLLHFRITIHDGIRRAFHADTASFFIPPETVLERYTKESSSGVGGVVSAVMAAALFPAYFLNVIMHSVNSPFYLNDAVLISTRAMLYSVLYASLSLTPWLIGKLNAQGRSRRAYRSLQAVCVCQDGLQVLKPRAVTNFLVCTPRAGWGGQASIRIYTYGDKRYDTITFTPGDFDRALSE